MLAACDPSIVEWAVLAATSMFLDVWRLSACVRAEVRTHVCKSGSGMAAVAIAVDRETADALSLGGAPHGSKLSFISR